MATKYTENMIRYRIEYLDEAERAGRVEAMYAIGERGFLDDLLQAEKGSITVEAENAEAHERRMLHLAKVEEAQVAALGKLNRLTSRIEDMKYNCDAEVYEALLDIFDTLNV